MRILADTHAVLWWLTDDAQLSNAAREAIAGAEEPLVSAGTLFEASIKASLGKLDIADGWIVELLAEGFGLLPIDPQHAIALQRLPFVEVGGTLVRDPFDRLLVAQALVEQVPVVTRDAAITAHGVPTIW